MGDNIPYRIGKRVKNGILITDESHSTVNRHLLDICRTVLGRTVKHCGDPGHNYMVVPEAFVRLIMKYEELTHVDRTRYANLSLQEFLMKSWNNSP